MKFILFYALLEVVGFTMFYVSLTMAGVTAELICGLGVACFFAGLVESIGFLVRIWGGE